MALEIIFELTASAPGQEFDAGLIRRACERAIRQLDDTLTIAELSASQRRQLGRSMQALIDFYEHVLPDTAECLAAYQAYCQQIRESAFRASEYSFDHALFEASRYRDLRSLEDIIQDHKAIALEYQAIKVDSSIYNFIGRLLYAC